MNILHNLITVISMLYAFIFFIVGAYCNYLIENEDCIHGNPKIRAFEQEIVPKLDLTYHLSYFLGSLMFLNAILHIVIFVKKWLS